MKPKYVQFGILALGIIGIIFFSGCATQIKDTSELKEAAREIPSSIEGTSGGAEAPGAATLQPTGPSGCSSDKDCFDYCKKNPFDCKAWCEVNEDTCREKGIAIDIPSGIPGSPCADDDECLTGLCLGFTCDIPSPDNLAKKSGFSLPGGCKGISACAAYCGNPDNAKECLAFCGNFPSFCTFGKEASATPECKSCSTCGEKSCILDCTDRCYQYMNIKKADIAGLKKGVIFERNFQQPIWAVWEPGPAFNRIGINYFTDEYKDLGVNTYSIMPKYNRDGSKLVHSVDHSFGESADIEKIASIIKAKKAGFQVVLAAHDLYDMFPDANKNEKFNPEEYIGEIKKTSLKWAEIAEEYQVEYFVPINEFEYILYENGYPAEKACEITNQAYRDIIPQVREIFKGKIYCRVGGMDAKFGCMDFSLCDAFGVTYGFTGGKDYKKNFDMLFEAAESASSKSGKPYLMAEAFALLIQGTTVDDCAELHRAGIASYQENAKNGIGYTFMGLVQKNPIDKNDCTIAEAGVVDDYKRFFKRDPANPLS